MNEFFLWVITGREQEMHWFCSFTLIRKEQVYFGSTSSPNKLGFGAKIWSTQSSFNQLNSVRFEGPSNLPQASKKNSINYSSAWMKLTFLQRFNWNCIWWIPVSIKDFLQLRNNGRVICSEADTCSWIEVIPYQVARPDVGSNVTDCIFAMVNPGKAWVDVSCTSPIVNGRPCQVEARHLVVLDLNFAWTFVVLWRIAEDIGVEERLQILICVVNKMSPICY